MSFWTFGEFGIQPAFRNRFRQLVVILMLVGFIPSVNLVNSQNASAAEVSTSTLGFNFAIAATPGESTYVWTLYLSSSETGTASVDFPTGADTSTVLIRPGVTSSVPVPSNDYMAGNSSGLLADKVTKITSTVPISVYGCSRQSATSDCTNFIPISSWGNRYRTLSYPTTINNLGDRVTVLTGSDTATITMRFKTNVTTASGTFSAGSETSTVMSPNRVWTLEAINSGQGFTGSLITSTAPVGVIAGADCINGFGGACDTNVEMVPPESSWGKNFYLNNYKNESNPGGSGVRILASQDSTTVTISGDETRTATLNAGEIFSEKLFQTSNSNKNLSIAIVASKPVLVGHYMISGTYTSIGGSDIGDPALSYMPPFEQFLSEYTVVSAGGFKAQFINVVIPTVAISTLKLDGTVVSSSLFRQVSSSAWSSAQITTTTGSHNLIASQPFGIEIYGADSYDSYAYVGGANYSALSTVASLRLSASSATGTVGQQICIPVTVLDSSDAPVLGVRVDGTTTGSNSGLFPSASTNSSGVASVCYIGGSAGNDTLTLTANGFSTTVSITWTLVVPSISYTPSTVSLATSVAMPTLTPTNTGGAVSSWSVSPTLPTGLSMDTSTGVITGTPSADTTAANYVITATNASGSSSSTINLAVIPAVQPTISYTPNSRNFTLDTQISVLTPTTSGTFPSWSVSPVLPRGLSINAQSGVISGTPVRSVSQADYTVTATNSAGSSTTILTLAVVESIPDISFNISSFSFVKNSQISVITPVNLGSPATSWTITPTLSSGLSFSSLTGQISGTPSQSISTTTYTVTGTNSAGSDSATVQIAVVDNLVAPSISYATSSATLTLGTTMTPLSPTNSGGAVDSYSISPSIPSGLNFSTSTGIFSGNPSASIASTTFTVTAINAAGSSSATVTLSTGGVSVAPTPSSSSSTGLTVLFSNPNTNLVGFTTSITNYDPAFTYAISASNGASVTMDSQGRITVTGLTGQGTQATVTVTTSRSGYSTVSSTVTGSTTPAGPPPSYLKVSVAPRISIVGETIVCTSAVFIFVRGSVTPEPAKIDKYVYYLESNYSVIAEASSKDTETAFSKSLVTSESTVSCSQWVQQESSVARVSSTNSDEIPKIRSLELSSIQSAETAYKKKIAEISQFRKAELSRLLLVRSAAIKRSFTPSNISKARSDYARDVELLERLIGSQKIEALNKKKTEIAAAKARSVELTVENGIIVIVK